MPGWPCGLLSAGTFLIGEKWVAMHTGDTAEMAVYARAAINHCIEERGLAACAQRRLGLRLVGPVACCRQGHSS